MKKLIAVFTMAVAALGFSMLNAQDAHPDAAEAEELLFTHPVAVLPFEGRGREFSEDGTGKSVAELVSVGLMEAGVNTVERAELEKVISELNLSAVGLVDKETQTKIGRMTGAKILITGSVFKSGAKTFIVAKVIGTETSKVAGASVNGQKEPADLVPALNQKVASLLAKRGEKLLPAPVTEKSALELLAKTVQGNKRKVYVEIPENISVSIPDPAAKTAVEKLLLALGFELCENSVKADFAVTGEAFAVNGGAFSKFVNATGRIEMKIRDVKTDKILATGSQTVRVAGTAYQIAAKDALEEAALRLAVELFPTMK